jgi:hypothetical protein
MNCYNNCRINKKNTNLLKFQMKKITKICGLAGVYIILSLSLAGIVNATTLSVGDTGTLSQILGGSTDNIEMTDINMSPTNNDPQSMQENSYNWHDGSVSGKDEWIGFSILSGALNAQVNLESTGLLRVPDGQNSQAVIGVYTSNIPYEYITDGTTTDNCDWNHYCTQPNYGDSSCRLNENHEVKIFDITGCTDLSGQWITRDPGITEGSVLYSGIKLPVIPMPGFYAATLTATLVTW